MKYDGIAILTTVANFALYEKTSPHFPKNIPHYVIDGRNGMHSLHSIYYMFKKLKGKGIKWLIMADEDVIFKNPEKVFELIDHMEKNDFSICGVRDGGVISHRTHNPYVINTFFCILDFGRIEKIFNKKQIINNRFVRVNEFNDNLNNLKNPYNIQSLYEPYYPFFLWLRRRNFKFLFLDAKMPFHEDSISNSVYTPQGDLLLYHTWYARSYGENQNHTDRIEKVLANIPIVRNSLIQPVIFKNPHFIWQEALRKNLRRIKLRFKLKNF